jgi:uncharacterized membrane protein YbhN (UPF0104 family)/tRNA A-37 threonylcarbamoyl transferase component Bud32
MAWLRETDERFERRPPDAVRLVVAAIGVVLAGMWAQTQSQLDRNLFQVVNALGDGLEGVAKVFYYGFGSIWTVLGVSLVLLVLRQVRTATQVAIAGTATWGIALLLNEILGTHAIKGMTIDVRVGDGPQYPAVYVAVALSLALALSPYVVRPLRRLLGLVVVMVVLATMYLGAGLPADIVGGLFLATAVVAVLRLVTGSPAGRPTIGEARAAVADLGYDVADVHYATEQNVRSSVLDVVLVDGRHLRVDAFGRDQRDARAGAKLWRRMLYKEPGLAVFGTRVQETEHIAYALMLAERAGVAAPRLERTGVGGADVALLVTRPAEGRPLSELADDDFTDDLLASVWRAVVALHDAGLSHGNLDAYHVLVSPDGSVAFDDFASADVSGDSYYSKRDDASVIVQSALAAGNERATAAALTALGKERLADVIPFVQPAALPRQIVKGEKHLAKALKALRTDLAAAAEIEDVQTLKIKRLDWANIGIMIGVIFALCIAYASMSGVNWASVKGEFENATWGWAVLALVMYPLIPTSWATALMGCVNHDLPFVPTVITQQACSFLNLITPNGIGGTALQLDYLHKQGVPVASGGSAMVLSTGVGGAIQMILFLSAAAITATTVDTSGPSVDGSQALIAIALVAALIGIVWKVPKLKNKIVPAVTKAASDIWAVIRNPHKAMLLIGGDTAGNLIYPAILGVCLLAFHQHLDFAQLVVVQVGAGMVGNVAPVPGGIGVTEAALTGALTAFGIPAAPALATVLVFRGITFVFPAFLGFFTLRWLRAKGYA